MKNETKYYGNQACTVVAELDGHEAVIQLIIGEVCIDGGSYDEPPYVEPYETKIIVDKRHLSDDPLTKDSILAAKIRMIKEAECKADRIVRDANILAGECKRDAEKEMDELRKRIGKFEAHGLVEYLNFLEGKYEWFVCVEDYHAGIRKIDECMCSCDKNELAAVSFRRNVKYNRKDLNKGWLYLNQYSEDSGDHKKKVKGFATLDEAKAHLVHLVESGEIKASSVCGKRKGEYTVTSPKIEAHKAEMKEKTDERRKKEIERKKKELEALTNGESDMPF